MEAGILPRGVIVKSGRLPFVLPQFTLFIVSEREQLTFGRFPRLFKVKVTGSSLISKGPMFSKPSE